MEGKERADAGKEVGVFIVSVGLTPVSLHTLN